MCYNNSKYISVVSLSRQRSAAATYLRTAKFNKVLQEAKLQIRLSRDLEEAIMEIFFDNPPGKKDFKKILEAGLKSLQTADFYRFYP